MTVASTYTSSETDTVQTVKQKSEIIIRSAKLEDIETLGDLWFYQRCYHKQWDKLYETVGSGQQKWKEYVLSCLNQQNHCILVAVDHLGTIVGYIHGSFYPWSFSPFEVYGSLNTVAINPEIQGQGIGKKLVYKLLDWFKKQEIQHISVHVDYRNEVALRLYETVGFRLYQQRLMVDLKI